MLCDIKTRAYTLHLTYGTYVNIEINPQPTPTPAAIPPATSGEIFLNASIPGCNHDSHSHNDNDNHQMINDDEEGGGDGWDAKARVRVSIIIIWRRARLQCKGKDKKLLRRGEVIWVCICNSNSTITISYRSLIDKKESDQACSTSNIDWYSP
jgi:hypothetical protein